MACKESYKPNENVNIFDIIEGYGESANCNISLYNYSYNFYSNLTMQQEGLKYNYSFGTNLSLGEYRATIECQKEASPNCTDVYLGECNFVVEGEYEMASLAVVLFVGAITLALFIVGVKHDFSRNPIANLIFKRVCILLGLFLISLDTAMVVTIADNAGLGVNRELFRYLWLINWTIYGFMVYLFWTTLTNGLKLWQKLARMKRMGGNFGGEEEYD